MSWRATSPELVRVMACAELAVLSCCAVKVSEVEERASVAGSVPVPLSEAVWVPAELGIVKLPVCVPETVGLKAMETVQPVLAARVTPQVFAVMAKSPVTEAVPSVAGVPPVFDTVMFWTALVEPTVVAG